MVKYYVINKLAEYDWSDYVPIGYLESQVSCAHGNDFLGVSFDIYRDSVVEERLDHLSNDRNHRASSNQHEAVDLIL